MIRVYDKQRDGEYEYGGKTAYDYLGEVIEKLNPDLSDCLVHLRLTYHFANGRFDTADYTELIQFEPEDGTMVCDDDWWEGQDTVDLLGWVKLEDIEVPDNV